MDAGDYDSAIKEFTKAIALRPDNADAFFERGMAQCLKIEVDAALTDFDKAFALAPTRVDFYKRRGACRLRYAADNEERNEVIADFEKGMALDPSDAELYVLRGSVRIANEDFTGALADHDRVIALAPADPDGYGARGHLKLAFFGDYAGAVADADKAIELGAGRYPYEVYAVRGKALQAQGRQAEAERDFKKCRQLNTRCENSLERISRLLERLKQRRK